MYFESDMFISLKFLVNEKSSGRLSASVVKQNSALIIKPLTDYLTGKWG